MIDKEYAEACTEVIVILNNMSLKDYNKIPKELINALEENKSHEYNFYMDYSNGLKEQKISNLTKAMLNVLYKEYWASEDKKRQLEQEEKQEYIKLEELKRQKYNPDDIFKKEAKKEIEKVQVTDVELLPVVKENWYVKAKNFIRKLLKLD